MYITDYYHIPQSTYKMKAKTKPTNCRRQRYPKRLFPRAKSRGINHISLHRANTYCYSNSERWTKLDYHVVSFSICRLQDMNHIGLDISKLHVMIRSHLDRALTVNSARERIKGS
jgi:hypothetical protein